MFMRNASMAVDEENGHAINCSIEPHSDWADTIISHFSFISSSSAPVGLLLATAAVKLCVVGHSRF